MVDPGGLPRVAIIKKNKITIIKKYNYNESSVNEPLKATSLVNNTPQVLFITFS